MVELMLSQVGLTIIGLFLAMGLGYCVVTLIIWNIHSFHRGNYLPVASLRPAWSPLSIRASALDTDIQCDDVGARGRRGLRLYDDRKASSV